MQTADPFEADHFGAVEDVQVYQVPGRLVQRVQPGSAVRRSRLWWAASAPSSSIPMPIR
ncbi:hypothetical protein ACFQ0Q_12240 [Streptomyces aureus]